MTGYRQSIIECYKVRPFNSYCFLESRLVLASLRDPPSDNEHQLLKSLKYEYDSQDCGISHSRHTVAIWKAVKSQTHDNDLILTGRGPTTQ